jgi:hypothetical protein
MTTRTAKPEVIHNLTDWVKRWPKNDNLEFDSVSREPSVYKPLKRGDPGRTKVTNEALRWKREADVMTVLSQPKSFSPEMVESATAAYRKYKSDMENLKTTNIDILRQHETAVLNAWDSYHAAPSPATMQDVLQAEKDCTAIETLLTEQTHQGRSLISHGINVEYKMMYPDQEKPMQTYKGIYDPVLPWRKRILGQGQGQDQA